MKKIICLMCATALLSSCHIYKSYDRPEDITTAGLYRDTASVNDTLAADTANFGNLPWREVFTDPQLQTLIEQALTNNGDLRSAALNVKQAQAALMSARLAYAPTLALSPQGTVSSWDKGKATQIYSLPVTASWQVDLFGQGVAFAAPSGTGKTTHIKLWQRLYGDRVEIINGDKPLFTLRSGRFFASGMPWCGKENWGCNKTVPLKAICFIDRAEHNSISPLEDNREIMSRLFLQLVMPEEHRLMVKYLDFANKLINTVPFYLLRCNMDLSVV